MNQQIFSRQKSLALVKVAKNMPTLPDRFFKIQEVIANPSSHNNDLVNIIKTDFSTSSSILKLANSTAYNPYGKPLSSLPHAVARLGISTAAKTAISMALLEQFSSYKSIAHTHSLWARSYARAMIAAEMCAYLKPPLDIDPASVFMMALLHDVGQLAISCCLDPDYFEKISATLHGDALCEAEKAMYGIDHAEAGSIILEKWRLPDILVQATLTHHQAKDHPAHHLCLLADDFVYKYWPNLQHIEEVQQLLCYSPSAEISAMLENSPELQAYI